jgi:hypothetical protein
LAKGRLQALSLNQLSLINRRSVFFWVLWIQLRTNVLVHFARQTSCKDAVLESWQEGKGRANLTHPSAQRREATVSPRGDIGTTTAYTRPIASTARACTSTPESTRRRERQDSASHQNDLTTQVTTQAPACAICMLSLRDGEVEATPCAHSFHRVCLQSWFARSRTRKCPTCNHIGLGAAKDDRGHVTPNGPNRDDSLRKRRRTPDNRGPVTPKSDPNTDGSPRKRRRTPTEPCSAQSNASQTDKEIREARLRRFGGAETNNARAASGSVTTDNNRASAGWDCPKCTFQNEDPLSLCCRMCGAASPMKAPPRASPSPSRHLRPPSGRRELFPKWQCKACTLENEYSALKCEACDTDFDESTSLWLPTQTTVTPAVAEPSGRPPRPPPRTNDTTPRNETKTKNRARCGACGLEGHNRGTATEENCTAYCQPEEIELRQKKKEKAETDARETRQEAERIRRRATESEAAQRVRLAEMQRIMMESQRDAEETQIIREGEVRRREKAAERAAKRARKFD